MAFNPKRLPGGFLRDERGTMSIEAAIIIPILFWAICATYTFFQVYKVQNATFRANYTISDLISRETGVMDASYMRGLHNVYQFMTFATTSDTWIRVSIVNCKSNCTNLSSRNLDIDWSFGTNGARELTNGDLSFWEDKIPTLLKGDALILLETSSTYTPMFEKIVPGFSTKTLVTHSVTRPRFTQQLVFDDGNGATNGGSNNGNGNNNSNENGPNGT